MPRFLLILRKAEAENVRVDLLVTFAVDDSWPQSRPRGHQQLLLV